MHSKSSRFEKLALTFSFQWRVIDIPNQNGKIYRSRKVVLVTYNVLSLESPGVLCLTIMRFLQLAFWQKACPHSFDGKYQLFTCQGKLSNLNVTMNGKFDYQNINLEVRIKSGYSFSKKPTSHPLDSFACPEYLLIKR